MIKEAIIGSFYNAAEDLIGRNLNSGRADKVAVIDVNGTYSYGDLDRQARQFANVLNELGVQAEQRIVICIHDTVAFPACFLGSILAGVIPVPVNTRLAAQDYEYILADSRAKVLVVASDLLGAFEGDLVGALDFPIRLHTYVSPGTSFKVLPSPNAPASNSKQTLPDNNEIYPHCS